MKTLFAFYLVFFRGYSVMRLCFEEGGCYGACDSELGFDYTHNGNWGKGETPVGAVINCWKNSRTNRITLQ